MREGVDPSDIIQFLREPGAGESSASEYVAVDHRGKKVFGPTRDYGEAKMHADRSGGVVRFEMAREESGAAERSSMIVSLGFQKPGELERAAALITEKTGLPTSVDDDWGKVEVYDMTDKDARADVEKVLRDGGFRSFGVGFPVIVQQRTGPGYIRRGAREPAPPATATSPPRWGRGRMAPRNSGRKSDRAAGSGRPDSTTTKS